MASNKLVVKTNKLEDENICFQDLDLGDMFRVRNSEAIYMKIKRFGLKHSCVAVSLSSGYISDGIVGLTVVQPINNNQTVQISSPYRDFTQTK